MAESTIDWFVVREKYCSLAEKVQPMNLLKKALEKRVMNSRLVANRHRRTPEAIHSLRSLVRARRAMAPRASTSSGQWLQQQAVDSRQLAHGSGPAASAAAQRRIRGNRRCRPVGRESPADPPWAFLRDYTNFGPCAIQQCEHSPRPTQLPTTWAHSARAYSFGAVTYDVDAFQVRTCFYFFSYYYV